MDLSVKSVRIDVLPSDSDVTDKAGTIEAAAEGNC